MGRPRRKPGFTTRDSGWRPGCRRRVRRSGGVERIAGRAAARAERKRSTNGADSCRATIWLTIHCSRSPPCRTCSGRQSGIDEKRAEAAPARRTVVVAGPEIGVHRDVVRVGQRADEQPVRRRHADLLPAFREGQRAHHARRDERDARFMLDFRQRHHAVALHAACDRVRPDHVRREAAQRGRAPSVEAGIRAGRARRSSSKLTNNPSA